MSFRSPSPGVAVSAGVLVAGCAVGPDYKRPQIDAPVPVTAARTLDHQRQLTRWWRRFGDPRLEAMTEHAASENLNIRTAVARLADANARLGLAEAERRPAVNAQADAVRERTPGASGNTATTLSVVGSLSWEIDLWGRLARGREAALAELEQSPNALMGELDFGKGSIEGISAPVLDMDDLSASLIARRPDNRAAKAALMAAAARIDARRTLLDAELALSEARREQLTAAATLFKALGGGWSREP